MTRITQVDAFSGVPFRGNPAAVCILDHPTETEWMQSVAAEMNLSETAFLWAENGGYRLRWFTPLVEVDLCGHATLASAHVLWESGRLDKADDATFHTNSGALVASFADGWIVLDFPAEPPVSETDPALIETALRCRARSAWRNRFDMLIELETEEQVLNLVPDVRLLAGLDCRGVIVTSRSNSGSYDFVSRFFAPAVGINEDPVTGSAHCFLGPFWGERLDKQSLIGYQASARGGIVKVELRGERVGIAGQAVTVMEGELFT